MHNICWINGVSFLRSGLRKLCISSFYCWCNLAIIRSLISVWSMFNRSKGSNSPPVSTVTPIDEDEQSKIADEIKQQAAAQSQTLRTIFHYIFLVVVLILFICLLYSIFSPWEMQHQQVFQGIVPIYGFFAYYGGSMYCYGISAMIVKVCESHFQSFT